MNQPSQDLLELAEFHGVLSSYVSVRGELQHASADSLIGALRCLDVPIRRTDQAPELLRDARSKRAERRLEPVNVVWLPDAPVVALRLPRGLTAETIACRLVDETGEMRDWTVARGDLAESSSDVVEGRRYVEYQLAVEQTLTPGYYLLEIEVAGQRDSSAVLAAPRLAYTVPQTAQRSWGVFLPLYALHSNTSWGAGDFADLGALYQWVARQGGNLVATLPLLASFLDEDGDESPYRPASRLLWNEFYLDLTAIEELAECTTARQRLQSTGLRHRLTDLRSAATVDYRRQMALKREVLEQLSRHFFEHATTRRGQFERFVREHEDVELYARFRATGETRRAPWSQWPESLRAGTLEAHDYDAAAYQYHLYVQWLVHEQLSQLSQQARQQQLTWYLDLPLGVHPHGFDVWRHQDIFAHEASGGAPPDKFFTKGQRWDFPPIHPHRQREQGYKYLTAVLRAHLQYAKLLRIDHVMGLHRLFWIPDGMEASDGVYVRYPTEESFAVVNIESQRHQARIIGENLGTVPREVDQAMEEHDVGRLYVVQFECQPKADRAMADVEQGVVASLNTHDMPPFTAFWQGIDIEDRLDLELISPVEAEQEHKTRRELRAAVVAFLRQQGLLADSHDDAAAVMEACLAFLAGSEAETVLINLEDLWGETRPQNTPGTFKERKNWQNKAQLALPQFKSHPGVLRTLHRVNQLRQSQPGPDDVLS